MLVVRAGGVKVGDVGGRVVGLMSHLSAIVVMLMRPSAVLMMVTHLSTVVVMMVSGLVATVMRVTRHIHPRMTGHVHVTMRHARVVAPGEPLA